MRFALLGGDAESLPLAAAALAAGHELTWQGDISRADREAFAWLAESDAADEWEDLLIAETADAILIGRGACGADLRARQVQELARLGRPMLVTFPLFDSVLTYFEVDMSRTEGGAILVYYNPLREVPAVAVTLGWIAQGHPQFGRVEQITATRTLRDRSREQVLRSFAPDVDLLSYVAGKLNRLGAHAATGNDADYSALSVQLLGAAELPVRWHVEPPADVEGLNLQFICERGRETIRFDSHSGVGQDLQVGAATAIGRFTSAITAQDAAASNWLQALRAMELTDSIEISLRRGRMIDVHDQQLTEQLAFKGTMSAFGCAVLLLIIPGLLALGWLAGAVGIPLAEYWPHVLLAILTIFLGLQFLPKLLYKAPER
ncbi:MAG: hypothetical protein JNL18_17715 [Planctomycetaceae bacterium]|nr:hypothetical protein [Planctomycetaceae bacterium]